jgi:DNA-binding NarL/FixJ family response regulator
LGLGKIKPLSASLKILVVDDHPFPRKGVVTYLRLYGFEVMEAGDEETGYALALQHSPQAAVLDIVIPPGTQSQNISIPASATCGIRLGRRLKQRDPAIGLVFLSSYADYNHAILDLVREHRLGLAYKSKTSPPEELLEALQRTLAGGVIIDSQLVPHPRSLADELLTQLTPEEKPWILRALASLQDHRLTSREEATARWLARSRKVEGIALALNISPKTVETYVTRVYSELGLDGLKTEAPYLRQDIILAKAYTLYDLLSGNHA